MTLPQFYLWYYLATKNLADEAKLFARSTANELAPIIANMMGAQIQ